MTTKVTVDAHAGWPVRVTLLRGESSSIKTVEEVVVEPNTIKEFYIHSGLELLNIKELPREQ